jgi:hypothetical protein
MNEKIVVENQIDLLVYTVDLLLIVLELGDSSQAQRVADYLVRVVSRSRYFLVRGDVWYFLYRFRPVYTATILGLQQLGSINQDQPVSIRSITRLRQFLLLVKENLSRLG